MQWLIELTWQRHQQKDTRIRNRSDVAEIVDFPGLLVWLDTTQRIPCKSCNQRVVTYRSLEEEDGHRQRWCQACWDEWKREVELEMEECEEWYADRG